MNTGSKMYFNDDERHHTPHFHAKYGGDEASFGLDGERITGRFPKKQEKYVEVWADIHKSELKKLWDTVQNDETYFEIKGLE